MGRNFAWTGIAVVLLTAQSVAEESSATDDAAVDTAADATLTALLPTTAHLSDWLLDDIDVVEVGAYPTHRYSGFAALDFRESSAIKRLGKYRALSLVTFADLGTARLFLGVNEDGLLGLHLNATPKVTQERTVEVLRMPYLEPRETDETGDRAR